MIALTPYQLLEDITHLDKVKWVLLGGSQIPLALVEPLKSIKTPVYQTFAMTETLTNFAKRKVNQVEEEWPAYEVFPEVEIQVNEENCLSVHFPKVTHGFLQTNDVVELTSPTSFYWLGRKDFVVNSGGIKMIVEELEEQLKPHIKFPFFLTGVPHPTLGQELVLVLEANPEQAQDFPFYDLKKLLPPLKAPRALFATTKFENTPTYKVNRKASLEKSVKVL
jgi:O-succinylbenzoic acid--CoA ligase